MLHAGLDLAAGIERERRPRHEDALEPAAQDRRRLAPPRRVHEHQRVGGPDELAVLTHERVDGRIAGLVRRQVLPAHRRVEPDPVQVERGHRVSGGLQPVRSGRGDRCGVAVSARVRGDDERAHRRRPALAL